MPLLDIQQRGRELGRIRIGAQVVRDGKSRPTKLDTFRLTTSSRPKADDVAALYGGQVREWSPRQGAPPAWEVLTGTDTLPVVIPPGHPLTQWWELWGGRPVVCERRCDGQTEQLTGRPCRCPPPGQARRDAAVEGRACAPISRLSVMLPDVNDLGIWLLRTSGYNAALELAGTAELLHRAATSGAMIPATLRLEQRERRAPGQPIAKYAVPVLELGATLRALAAGQSPDPLPPPAPPSPAAAAITTGDPVDVDVDVESLVAHAVDAVTRDEVAALAARAEAAGVLDNTVPDTTTGELLPLRELLRRRHREVTE